MYDRNSPLLVRYFLFYRITLTSWWITSTSNGASSRMVFFDFKSCLEKKKKFQTVEKKKNKIRPIHARFLALV
jgi:hypothetical protein